MRFLDFFKSRRVKRLEKEIETLKELLTPEHYYGKTLKELIQTLEIEKAQKEQEVENLRLNTQRLHGDISQLDAQIKLKKESLVVLDEEILIQEFGLYDPIYEFASSDQYKDALTKNRQKQKQLIKNKTCVDYSDNWTVDGSKAKGRKMNNDNIKQIIRTFNVECESIIDRLTFMNVENMKKRIDKSFESLNKMNETNKIALRKNFLKLKHEELQLAYEYQVKKQEEKEEQKRIREELREQAKLQKELEEQRKNALKDLKHYETALEKVQAQVEDETLSKEAREALQEKQLELTAQMSTISENLANIDYRQANQRAGYVYIISNIGAFGENIYKIGMTRRLEPQERIDELSGASVPFKFDVHAMIFTHDAPALENALHKAFDSKKVNMVNSRKEFFRVTLDEIEEVVKSNFDNSVSFKRIPEAEQFRESQRIWEKLSSK